MITANVHGVALIDPVKSENIAYLDPEKRFTLFFEGKAYNLKDQSNIKEIIAAKMEAKPVHEQEQLKTVDIIRISQEIWISICNGFKQHE